MPTRKPADGLAAVGSLASRQVRPCPVRRPSTYQSHQIPAASLQCFGQRCAMPILLSAGLVCGPMLVPEPATAASAVTQAAFSVVSSRPSTLQLLAAPPPLASTAAGVSAASTTSGTALLVEEAEEFILDAVDFFQHGLEAFGSTVHHLQVVHALERLESMPLDQVVDLDVLKTAMHPPQSAAASRYGLQYGDDEEVVQQAGAVTAASNAAALRLDAALDSVAGLWLREVVDVRKLADALQDVQLSGSLDARSLQREALRLRRTVHWEVLAEAVKPMELRRALSAFGAVHSGSPFSEMDIRAALSAVRMDAVRQALSPSKPSQQRGHSLDSSGMWTWESM